MTQDKDRRAESEPKMTIKLRMDSANNEHIRASLWMGRDRNHLSNAGQLVLYPQEWGLFQEILAEMSLEREVTVEVLSGGEEAENILKKEAGISQLERSGNELHFSTELSKQDLAVVLRRLVSEGVEVLFFSEEEGTLEDLFLQVTKGGL